MEDRGVILEKIAEACRLEAGRLTFVVPQDSAPASAERLPIPRLIVMLSGSKTALLPLPDGKADVRLDAGDMLYCLPDSWEKHDWRGHYEMLCVVPRQDYLRVSFYCRSSSSDGSRPEPVFLHTGLPYHEMMRCAVQAMNAAARMPDAAAARWLAKALLEAARHECQRSPHAPDGRPESLFHRMRNWLARSFQEEVTRQLVASVFNVTPGYVSQLFRKYCGCGFQDYLTQCRMEHARLLLERSELTVYQVADQSGFRNYVHFVRRFRELNGRSPGQYRHASRPHGDDGGAPAA